VVNHCSWTAFKKVAKRRLRSDPSAFLKLFKKILNGANVVTHALPTGLCAIEGQVLVKENGNLNLFQLTCQPRNLTVRVMHAAEAPAHILTDFPMIWSIAFFATLRI
jgi:hypothetical protein